jgi:BlaI family penicillinase repressor
LTFHQNAGKLHITFGDRIMAFNANELEIMKALWEQGALKPSDIQKSLPFPIKNSALRWQLAVLIEKGHVARSKKGKAFFYRALTRPQGSLKKFARQLAHVFSGGSAAALIGQMIEAEDLSPEEIRNLQKIASKKVPRSKSAKRGKKS